MEARGSGLGVTGEGAGLGDEFPCTAHICGQEMTPEAQLGRGTEGCSPPVERWGWSLEPPSTGQEPAAEVESSVH